MPNNPLAKADAPFDGLRVSGKTPLKSGWGSAHAEPVEASGGVFQRTAEYSKVPVQQRIGSIKYIHPAHPELVEGRSP